MIIINFLSVLLIIYILYKAMLKEEKTIKVEEKVKYKWLIFGSILLLGICIRLISLDKLPAGLNQDEASIAYDAYSLLENGYDRNGDLYPVYPVAWGAGHGPFYLYFSMIFMSILGSTVFAYRLGNAVLSIISLICMYFMLNKMFKTKYALIGMFILAISPWNIMLSRWALDANPLPSLIIIATTILIYAIDKKSTGLYVLAASIYSLSLYAYASAYIIVPLFLLFSISYLLVKKKITVKQVVISGIVFVLIAIPLGTFWIINFFDLEEIKTEYFSIPKLTALRSDSIFNFASNGIEKWLKSIIAFLDLAVFLEGDMSVVNSITNYGTYYLFTPILSIVGTITIIAKCKKKEFNYDYIIFAMFVAATIFTLMIEVNINRIHVIYIAILVFILKGVEWIGERNNKLLYIVLMLFVVHFACFMLYYTNEYNKIATMRYFESFDEAILYEKENNNENTTYVTKCIEANYMLTLFHSKYDTQEFINTVKYYENDVEFRMAESFGNYIFYLPEEIDYKANYIVHNSELNRFDKSKFDITTFKYYSAVISKSK